MVVNRRRQREEVLTNRSDIGCSPVTRSIAGDFQDRHFTKHRARTECRQHCHTVIPDHGQSATFHDVHLLAHVPFAANVVAGTEDLCGEERREEERMKTRLVLRWDKVVQTDPKQLGNDVTL